MQVLLTQVSFTNWATGGDNAFAFDLQGTYQADYKHNRHVWKNRLELAYGLNKTKGDGLKKTSDKIYLNSNYGYEIYVFICKRHFEFSVTIYKRI